MTYRELVCGLALLVHGTRQEKAKCRRIMDLFIYTIMLLFIAQSVCTAHVLPMCMYLFTVVTLLVSEDGSTVTKEHLEAIVSSADGRPPLTDLSDLFTDAEGVSCSTDQFERWVLTDEGREVVERGSHEARMFQAVDADSGSPQAELMVHVVCCYTWTIQCLQYVL